MLFYSAWCVFHFIEWFGVRFKYMEMGLAVRTATLLNKVRRRVLVRALEFRHMEHRCSLLIASGIANGWIPWSPIL
jgi:hypothetical protein